jgi:phage gpG-like protein
VQHRWEDFVIDFTVDQDSQQRLEAYVTALGPRLIVEIRQALKTLLYQGVQGSIQKYFAGSGPKGGSTSSLLTSRSGALVNSLLASAGMGLDPASPSAGTTEITAQIGSSLPYARIQEYGGIAGRPGPFKKKDGRRPYLPPRPYLRPTMDDLQTALPDLLQQAIEMALKSS